MKIIKYKYKGNSKYEIYTDDDKYIIYEDIIIKNNLLAKETINDNEFKKLLKDNEFYDCYYNAIKYIETKMRSTKEVKEYLLKKEYESKDINQVIKRLEEEGYINEERYAKAYIYEKINLSMDGPLKIKKYLQENNISEEIIEKELKTFTEDLIQEKLDKMISKEIRLNKNKSSKMLYEKVSISLINKGYKREDITTVFNNYEVNDEEIYKKEYEKLYNKLKDKYQGKELEYKIKQKMYQKGFVCQ